MVCLELAVPELEEVSPKSNTVHTTKTFVPPHDKTNKMACAPSEDSDQPGHSPSLTSVFAVRSMGS